jgi:SAM-dependent methyltransferase
MFDYVTSVLKEIEKDKSLKTRDEIFSSLRRLGVDDFGEILLQMPNAAFPRMSKLLPSMASVEVQNQWTGNNGIALLRQSCNFVRSVSYNYNRIVGRSIKDATVLDYGCGYGRIARLMYYFVDSADVVGVDPWDKSIENCNLNNMGENFVVSNYLPEKLPTSKTFDLSYAFSVFTHLSKRATHSALAAVRRSMKPNGVFCITIRPVEYWDLPFVPISQKEKNHMKSDHNKTGFAFSPHQFNEVNGEQTYGDTSISLDWLNKNAKGWKIRGIDRSLDDEYQIYVFMQAC